MINYGENNDGVTKQMCMVTTFVPKMLVDARSNKALEPFAEDLGECSNDLRVPTRLESWQTYGYEDTA